MKIFFTSPNLNVGGAQRHLINIINGLQRKGHSCLLFVYEEKGALENELLDSVRIFSPNKKNKLNKIIFFRILNGTIKLIKLAIKEKPDFIYSRHWTKTPNLIVGRFLSIKTICGEGNSIRHSLVLRNKKIRLLLRKITAKYSDLVIANSKGLSSEIETNFDLKNEPMVIYNGLDLPRIKKLAEQEVSHKWFDTGKPVIISVGRLVDQKDFHTLIDAFKIVNNTIDSRLLIIGSGKLKNKLIEYSEKLSIGNKIDIMENIANPFTYISKSDLYVCSSVYEGLSNSILEAMATGKAVVSTNHDYGAAEIINSGYNGLLVPPKNPVILAEKILEVLSNEDLKKSLERNASVRVEDFSVERMVDDYENLFSKWEVH